MTPKLITAAPQALQELYKTAVSAREKSYSPYSTHKVGAAIRLSNGQVYSGCNIENSSYGGTVCAERTAVFKAVSEHGQITITEVMVVTDAHPAWPPCGFCRQIVSEFAAEDLVVHAANLQGEMETTKFSDLLPKAFTPAHLGK